MKLDKLAGSRNDEYFTPKYAVVPIIKYLKKRGYKTIWCPFDMKKSWFVKLLKKKKFRVINTHIRKGQDFFETEVPECDCIVSNPPYSKKTEVIERLFKIGKPFAMLVGIVGLFESQKRFELFKNNKFEILYLNHRVSFLDKFSDKLPLINPPFSSGYICHKVLPKTICFRKIDKKDLT